MLARIGRLAERYTRWVIAGWLTAAVVLILVAPSLEKVGVQDMTAFLPASAPSQQANQVLDRLYPMDPTLDSGIVVFSRSPGPLTAADHAWITRWVTGLDGPAMRSRITSVVSDSTDPASAAMLRSANGRADLVLIGFRAAPFSTALDRTVALIRHQLSSGAPSGLVEHLTGVAGLAADQTTSLVSSFTRAALITVALVLLILFLVYRSTLAALVPLATIGVAYLVSRGLLGIMAAHGFKVASLVDTFLIVMVFGAGTDYCLFIVSRHRENLATGDPRSATLQHTMGIIGPVIVASGVTVIVGFMSQLTARFGLYRTMGPAIGIAIAVTVLAAVTLTPALLSIAGGRLFGPVSDQVTEARNQVEGPGHWQRLARTIRAHPAEVLLAGVALLELPATGLGWFRESFDLVRELPAGADARSGYQTIADNYPAGTVAPIYIVIDTPGPIVTTAKLAAVDRLTDYLKAQPGIAQVRSVTQPEGAPLTSATVTRFGGTGGIRDLGIDPNKVDITPLLNAIDAPGGLRFNAALLQRYPQMLKGPLSIFEGADGRSTRLVVTLTADPFARQALPIVRGLTAEANDDLAGTALSGSHLSVGGPATFFADMQTIGNHDFRVITAVLIAGVFVVLAVLLRSLVAPFYLLASVVASYAATLGLTSAVFDGIFHQQGISFWLPPFLFVILVALGADYTIFIMSRIKEKAAGGADIHEAVTRGLTATGRVITSAGIILAGAFAALVSAPLSELRQIGFAVTVGVLIDTFVVRTLIVPAATMLLGSWAFWPGVPAPAANRHTGRRYLGAGAAIATLATGLGLLATTGGPAAPIAQIASRANTPLTATAATAKRDSRNNVGCDGVCAALPTTTSVPGSDGSTGATALAGADQVTAATALPNSTTPTASALPNSTTPTTAALPNSTTPTTAALPNSTTPTTTPAAAKPTRVAIPATGAWRYHVTGTRKIGAAGSTQSFDETDTTQVSRQGGEAQTATMNVDTQTSTYTENDQRSYAPSGVDLVTTQFSADGITYGGTLQPPTQLIPWPATIGQSWSTTWTTGSTNGHTTGKVTGQQTLTVAGHAYECITVQTDTTFSGTAQGSQQGTTCWSPQLGMALQDEETMSGTYTGIPFDITAHFTLLATP